MTMVIIGRSPDDSGGEIIHRRPFLGAPFRPGRLSSPSREKLPGPEEPVRLSIGQAR